MKISTVLQFDCQVLTRRRLLIGFLQGTLAAPFCTFAQQQGAKVARIGFLGYASASGYANQVEQLRTGLREFGYVEGKNIVIEFRWAEGKYERFPEIAAELVRLKVDVIVTHGKPGSLAAKQATTTIPIVMAYSGDAVATGLIASLAHPGGNITGSTFFNPELGAKRLELLKEALPHLKQVAVLWNPDNPLNATVLQAMQIAAKTLKVELRQFAVRRPDELDAAFSTMTKKRVDALATMEDPFLGANDSKVVNFATKKGLLTIGSGGFSEIGGLMVYGANLPEMVRRAAFFIDKILKGTRPGDLPVEQPTKFELKVNLRTAKALGIKIPNSILVRADKVIQ